MDHLAPFFPLRNPIKDEDAPQKKRKRSRAAGEDAAGSATQPARISNFSSLPSQETSASPRASTGTSVAAGDQSVAAERASVSRPLSSASDPVVEPAALHRMGNSQSLLPGLPPSHSQSLLPGLPPSHSQSLPPGLPPSHSQSLPPGLPPSHCRNLCDKQSCEEPAITSRAIPAASTAVTSKNFSSSAAKTTSCAPSPDRSAPSLPQSTSPKAPHHSALALAQDQAASNAGATSAAGCSATSSSLSAPSESRCIRWTEEEKRVLRDSLKRELATGRDADYTWALTRAVNDFLQAFPHTSRTCSAIRQAARSLAAAQRESQGGHGREEGAVVTARPSLPQGPQAQSDHLAARRTSDQQPGSSGAVSTAPQSKGGTQGSPAREPVSKTTSAQLPPQRPHAPQLQRNAVPSGSGSGSISNASSLGMKSGPGGQRTPVCPPSSTSAMPTRTCSPAHSDPRTTRQQLFPPPFPTSFPPGEAFAGASITSTPGSSSSAANERPAQDGCAATVPGPAAISDTRAAASSFAARAPASSSATKEDGASGVHTGWFTGPLTWPWEKSGKTARVSTRCPTSSGRPGAPSPEPRSTSISTGVASSPTFPNWSSIGSGGGWSGPYRPFDLTRCGVPTIKTHFPPRSRASPAPKRARLSAEPEEMSSSLHVGIMNHCDDDVQFVECPPNRHIAVYTPYCVKITRDPPPSSGIPSFGRICKPIFALRGGEAGNYHTVQMPDDVEISAKTVSARSGVVVAMDTIFRSAANNLSVVLRLEVRRVVRSDGREGVRG